MDEFKEHELAVAFNAGSLEGFEGIYKLLYHPLYLFVRGLVRTDEAEDIVADTFVKLWKLHDRFHNFPDIRAFLYITARNTSLNYLKREKMKQEKHQELAQLSDEENRMAARAEIQAELIHQIRQHIERLPPREAEVFSLAFLDGYKNEEIAQLLRISYQTVSNIKNNALKKVRSAFKNTHPIITVFLVWMVLYLLDTINAG